MEDLTIYKNLYLFKIKRAADTLYKRGKRFFIGRRRERELKEKYPKHHKYNAQDTYYTSNFPPHAGRKGCAKAAFFLSDQIFGNMPSKVHHDLSKVKPADVVNDIEGRHLIL